jgi:serine/threonine protein kinase
LLTSPSLADDFDPLENIQANIKKSADRFAIGKAKFEQMLELAERNKSRGSYSSRGFPNSLTDGNHHLYDTQARFTPLKRLGRGSFGDVDEVQEVSTREVYARKVIQLPGNETVAAVREEEVRNEVRVMQKLTHNHIATVLFWLKEPGACSIFMKPAGDCDLRVYLESCTRDGNPEGALRNILPWFGCLLDALAFAHRLHVTHRDIKPSNILIKEKQVYLADFGLAKDFTLHGTSKTSNYFVCGTPVYRAPEVKPENPRGRPADVFSLGCVFSEMLTVYCERSLEDFQNFRRAPENECGTLAFRANLTKVLEWLNHLKEGGDVLCETLAWQLMLMLKIDPGARPQAHEAVNFLMNSNQRESFFCPFHI